MSRQSLIARSGKTLPAAFLLSIGLIACSGSSIRGSSPTSTTSETQTPTITPTFTPTWTATPTFSPTITPTPVPAWKNLGPFSGGWPLAIDPSNPTRLYASGGYGSIYRSENGGSTWIPVKNDPISVYLGSSGNVLADRFAIDPFDASYLYVLSSNGMERSSDFGSNWQTVAGEPHKRYDTFAVSPTEPSAVFVAYTDTKEKDYHNWTAGLLFSWDRGGHWGIVNDHLSKGLSHVTSIIFDPTDSATMYLGTNGDGVLKSIDGGKTWKAKNSGLPGSPACCEYHGKHFIDSMIIDPLNPKTLFLSMSGASYSSTNGGENWKEIDPCGILVYDPSSPATVYKTIHLSKRGLFKSTDSGQSWTTVLIESSLVFNLLIGPKGSNLLVAGTDSGIMASNDGGTTWKPIHEGFPALRTTAVAVVPNSPSMILAALDYMIMKSTDGGSSWNDIPNQPEYANRLSSLVFDPASPATVYAVGDTLYKSENGGDDWTEIGRCGQGNGYLVIDPMKTSTLYWKSNYGFCTSVNGGATWKDITVRRNLGYPTVVAIAATSPTTVYAAMGDGFIYRSSDGGKSWTEVRGGKQNFTGDFDSIRFLVIDPNDPGALLAVTTFDVYGSTDGGANWRQLSSIQGGGWIAGLFPDPGNPSILYIVVNDKDQRRHIASGMVMRSTDNGKTWGYATLADNQLPIINNLIMVPGMPTKIYAATDGGIFVLAL